MAVATFAVGCGTSRENIGGEFVTLRLGDTVSVERFRQEGQVLSIDIAHPRGDREEITAWLTASGEIDSLQIGGTDDDDHWTSRTVVSDTSVVTHFGEGGKTEEHRIPTRSRALPYWSSLALTELMLRSMRPATGEVSLAEVGDDSLRTYTVSRVGDTTVVADPRRLLWLTLDEQGSIQGGRTRHGYDIVRRSLGAAATRTGKTLAAGWNSWTPPDLRRFGKCPVSEPPFVAVSLLVHDSLDGAPTLLRGDGRGPYFNDVDDVGAISGFFMELKVPRDPTARPGSSRSLKLDLSQPVPGSGAIPRGVVGDSLAAITVFYRKDPISDSLFGPEYLSIGQEAPASRVELIYTEGNGWYGISSLSFGTFPRGYCETGHPPQPLTGTTSAILRRVSPTAWTVRIPRGSKGRLWTNVEGYAKTPGAEDRGLYYSSGLLEFSLLDH
jgi:hypothetical protein